MIPGIQAAESPKLHRRGGARPGTGGVRPGAGRKSAGTKTYQQTMRAVVESVVTEDEWREVLRTTIRQAKSGDLAAAKFLEPWVMGKVPDVVQHEGTADPIRVVIEYAEEPPRARAA